MIIFHSPWVTVILSIIPPQILEFILRFLITYLKYILNVLIRSADNQNSIHYNFNEMHIGR